MTEQTVGLLLLVVLLAPTLGAVAARVFGRWLGQGVARGIAVLGCVAGLSCGVVLNGADLDRTSLGSLAYAIPLPGPLVDVEALALPRATAVLAAVAEEPSVEVAEVTAAPSQTPTATAPPPSTVTPSSTASPSPTATAPLPTPSATVTPTTTQAPLAELTATTTPTAAPTPTAQPARAAVAYTVTRGDTLRGIAEQFGVSVDALLSYNDLTRAQGDNLQPDQKLRIPPPPSASSTSQRPEPAPTKRPAPKPRAYIVEDGDTLRGIAGQFNISVAALLEYNGLSREEGDRLKPGQKLFIPPR